MKRHSILFGVEHYVRSPGLKKLNCPKNDVAALKEVFENPLYAGPDSRCLPVVDPTLQEATEIIRNFLSEVDPNDVVIFYFSGHGLRDTAGDLFLCFRDSVEEDLDFTALNVSRLRDAFRKRRLKRVLVLLDCCYSGAAGAQMTKDTIQGQIDALEKTLDDGKGLYVLSSAGSTETAKEGENNSVFTHHLVDGIKTGQADLDNRGEITVTDVAQYLRRKVAEDASGQTPYLSSNAVSGTFVVALNEERRRLIEVEQQEAARQEIYAATRTRLIEALQGGHANEHFMVEISQWWSENPSCSPENLRYSLVAAYGKGEIDLVHFVSSWQQLGETKDEDRYQKEDDVDEKISVTPEPDPPVPIEPTTNSMEPDDVPPAQTTEITSAWNRRDQLQGVLRGFTVILSIWLMGAVFDSLLIVMSAQSGAVVFFLALLSAFSINYLWQVIDPISIYGSWTMCGLLLPFGAFWLWSSAQGVGYEFATEASTDFHMFSGFAGVLLPVAGWLGFRTAQKR